jgi:formate-dependent nitrite reductase membrane component NrfD
MIVARGLQLSFLRDMISLCLKRVGVETVVTLEIFVAAESTFAVASCCTSANFNRRASISSVFNSSADGKLFSTAVLSAAGVGVATVVVPVFLVGDKKETLDGISDGEAFKQLGKRLKKRGGMKKWIL